MDKGKKIVYTLWDRLKRILARLSPASVWTRLGLTRILSRISVFYWICAFIVAGLIFFFCAQSGQDSGNLSSSILAFLTKIVPSLAKVENAEYIIRKIGHFTIFALESILLSAAFYTTFSGKRTTKRWLIAVLLTMAVLSEAVQFLAEERAPTVKDVIIDFSGAVLGFVGYTIFYALREKRIRRMKKENTKGQCVRIFEKGTKWLTAAEFMQAEPINVFHREMEPEAPSHADELKNFHMYARRAFRMGRHAERAELLITADDYYKLYINGVYVAQGPAPGYPSRYYVNRIDVLKYLRSGENVIAIDLYYQGLNNRVWVSGDLRQGFMCELHVDGKVILRSDEHFHYMKSASYVDKAETGYRTQFTEHFDLRNEPKGWKDIGFDDFMWTACFAKADTDYKFVWQETPLLDTEIVKPDRIEQEGNVVHVDFGKEISGVMLSEFEGAKGKKVVLRMGEELAGDGKSARYETRANCVYEHSFILDGEINEWEMYDYCAFRYADFILEKGVRLVRAEARRQYYPLDEEKCTLDTTEKNLKEIFE
ncbi:MAG: VanZ family protein, partial [Clostridia bacterium]|nr:VanZ family protein [Clostridia bacterium]